MPVKQSFIVKAKDVKVGDFVPSYGRVTARDSKVKWTTITFLEETLRVLNDSDLEVIREVPTAEEKAAVELKFRLESLDHADQQAHTLAATAREKVAASLASGNLPGSSWLEDAYVYTQYAAIWDRISHVSRARAGSDTEVDRIEATRLVAAKVREEIENFVRWRPLSRSTSSTSNWIEDAELQAKGKFLEELKWIILEG